MAKTVRGKYKVTFLGANGKRESQDIEANSIVMIDSVEDSMVCFNNGSSTVFALPFSNFISASKIPAENPQKASMSLQKIKAVSL